MGSNEEDCRARQRGCGTPSGWRNGGRCPTCRAAHNAETNRYRGLTTQQREDVLALLRAGRTPSEAAAAIGKTVRHLSGAAGRDSELRAALDGEPPAQQYVVRRGDYLAALTRARGNRLAASRELGLKPHTAATWRSDPLFAAAEDAVRAMIDGSGVKPRSPGKVTEADLDRAADLIESGMTLHRAAQEVDLNPATLRYHTARHPRLAAAMNTTRRGVPGHLNPETESRMREMWADQTLTVMDIARRLGVSPNTIGNWRRRLDLPSRR